MEENLEISKSKFFLSFSLSLSEKKKERRNSLSLFSLSLSLFTFEVSLFRPKKVRFARNRERGYMICSRRFVSLFKKCSSRLTGVGVLKKKSDEFNAFEHKIRVEKKRNIFQNLINSVPQEQQL